MSKNAHDALMAYLDKEDAHMRAVGLGELNDQTLLIEAARSLAFIGEESLAYTLANHARRKGSTAWSSDPKVAPALARGAADGDRFAQELQNRLAGKSGLYEEAAASEYWRMEANEYREAGNDAAAALCERIAAKPDGGRDLMTTHVGRRTDKRGDKRKALLREYEQATAHLVPKDWPVGRRDRALPPSDAEFAIASKLAADNQETLHDYRTKLARERNARKERETLK